MLSHEPQGYENKKAIGGVKGQGGTGGDTGGFDLVARPFCDPTFTLKTGGNTFKKFLGPSCLKKRGYTGGGYGGDTPKVPYSPA